MRAVRRDERLRRRGAGGAPSSLRDVVDHAPVIGFTAPRPNFGAVIVANDGDRIYAVESRRDVEPGPYGLPWRSRFRLAAYDNDGGPAWTFDAAPDDVVSDVAVHASGDVTVAVLHFLPERLAYDLVRLDRNGVVRATLTMSEPQTPPASDFGPSDPRPLFRMKSDFADATVGGWVRLLPDGDDLIVTFLSYLDVGPTEPGSNRWALGLETLHWQTGGYVERWARVVEGLHAAQPVAWTYDELRQDEQAIRPFLARDEVTGDILVGRAWNSLRCKANVAVFAEFTMADCISGIGQPRRERALAAGRDAVRFRRGAQGHQDPRSRRGRGRAGGVRARRARRQARHRRLRRAQERRRLACAPTIRAHTSTTTATSRSTTATATRCSTTTSTSVAATCWRRSAGCPTTSSPSARRAGIAGKAATASRAAPIR